VCYYLRVFRIVYSLDSTSARRKLRYEIKKLGLTSQDVVEYYANTDPYLALVMGVSALPREYTVVKFVISFVLLFMNIKFARKNT
jgi:hypothetical protein